MKMGATVDAAHVVLCIVTTQSSKAWQTYYFLPFSSKQVPLVDACGHPWEAQIVDRFYVWKLNVSLLEYWSTWSCRT